MSGKSGKIEKELEENKAYLRHVKRYVQAPVHRFAAVTPPELSLLCKGELSALGMPDLAITEAGVEFSGDLSACYLSNLWLRTASRILCRLPAFRAGAAEELFHKVCGVPWELWLNRTLPLHVEAFVEHSRIEHEGVVADTVVAAVRKRFMLQKMEPPGRWKSDQDSTAEPASLEPLKQRMLIHLKKNQCRISLDTTGAHLHQRGYRRRHMGAPLRETLAAGIIMRSGWRGDSPLVDGMCGSGTFAIEAALMGRHLPPGLSRPFLFEKWPAFQEKTWGYLCRKARENALPHSPVPIVGIDHDCEAIAVSRENAFEAGVGEDIRWINEDFFQFHPRDLGLKPGLLLLNPPYGLRLEGGGKELYAPLAIHLRRAFAGWHVAILVPDRSLAVIMGLPSMRFWTIKHGGLSVMVGMTSL